MVNLWRSDEGDRKKQIAGMETVLCRSVTSLRGFVRATPAPDRARRSGTVGSQERQAWRKRSVSGTAGKIPGRSTGSRQAIGTGSRLPRSPSGDPGDALKG